jgi:hypothetical protein
MFFLLFAFCSLRSAIQSERRSPTIPLALPGNRVHVSNCDSLIRQTERACISFQSSTLMRVSIDTI